MTAKPLDLTEARFAILETLQHGDWQAIPMDGDGSRILVADVDSKAPSYWIVSVEACNIEAASDA